jgi:hypothetical protein
VRHDTHRTLNYRAHSRRARATIDAPRAVPPAAATPPKTPRLPWSSVKCSRSSKRKVQQEQEGSNAAGAGSGGAARRAMCAAMHVEDNTLSKEQCSSISRAFTYVNLKNHAHRKGGTGTVTGTGTGEGQGPGQGRDRGGTGTGTGTGLRERKGEKGAETRAAGKGAGTRAAGDLQGPRRGQTAPMARPVHGPRRVPCGVGARAVVMSSPLSSS